MKDHSTVIVSKNVGKEEASEVRKEEKKRYERLGKKKKLEIGEGCVENVKSGDEEEEKRQGQRKT